MTIPESYVGLGDFVRRDLIQECYCLNSQEAANRWINEDIVSNYGNDFRIHFVRLNTYGLDETAIKIACDAAGIRYYNHNTEERIGKLTLCELFVGAPLTSHVVIALKNLLRRANLVPNAWKQRIGALHERFTKRPDYNVHVEGLPGRLTGYWRDWFEGGRKFGPIRTFRAAIDAYEETWADPFGKNSYQCAGFKKTDGKVTSKQDSALSPHNLIGLDALDENEKSGAERMTVPIVFQVTRTEFESIEKSENGWDDTTILQLIRSQNEELYSVLETIKRIQIVCPCATASYNKLIGACVSAAERSKPCAWPIAKQKASRLDTYQMYLDNKEFRIVVCVYKGKL